MTLKQKALVFNFIGFAVIFVVVRLLLGQFVDLNRVFLAIIAAITASVLAPKFTVVRLQNTPTLVMKWIFKKEIKEF